MESERVTTWESPTEQYKILCPERVRGCEQFGIIWSGMNEEDLGRLYQMMITHIGTDHPQAPLVWALNRIEVVRWGVEDKKEAR